MRVVLASLLAGLAAFATIDGARAQTVLKLDPYEEKQLSLPVEAGGVKGRLLFDTGEGVTMISPSLAKAAGCEPWAHLSAFRMGGERLDAPRCDDFRLKTSIGELRTRSTLVYDLAEIIGKDAPPLDGALGLDAFEGQAITLRLATRQVVVETPASLKARTAKAIPVPIRLVRDAEGTALVVNLGVPTPKGVAWMELDSANKGPTIFISQALAPVFKLDPGTREKQDVAFDIAPGVAFKGQARVFPNMTLDGNIGMQLMNDWDVTLDLATGRGWLSPARPLPH
jgi:hypothetical protein